MYRLSYGVRVLGTFLLTVTLKSEVVIAHLVTIGSEVVDGDDEVRCAEDTQTPDTHLLTLPSSSPHPPLILPHPPHTPTSPSPYPLRTLPAPSPHRSDGQRSSLSHASKQRS